MKILSITAQKPHSTGSGTYMTELVKAFDRMGHSQAVVCGIFPSDEVDFPEGVICYPVFFEESKGASASGAARASGSAPPAAPCKAGKPKISTLPFPVVGMSDIMPYTSTRYRDLTPRMIALFESAFSDAVKRAAYDLDPDLIICHHLFLLTSIVRKILPDKKVIGISHGTDLRQMINCDNLRDIVRPYIKDLDLALALHEEQRRQIIDIFGMDESRVKVIGSGYNDRLFNTDGREAKDSGAPLRITYAGKISRPKGVPEMLEALARLADDPEVPPFELTMAGGCQDEVLKEKMADLPPWAAWLGQIPQPALAGLLRRTDIFVLPSYFEGLPLVLIEAMAAGAVPVSTDLPGVKDWISENVRCPNIRYVTMPQMKSIDEPTDSGRAVFVDDLCSVLKKLMADPAGPGVPENTASADHPGLPDTSSITWSGVASRLLSF